MGISGESTVESRFFEPPWEKQIVLSGGLEKGVKLQYFTGEGKLSLVPIIRNFKKLRVREVGIYSILTRSVILFAA